MKLLLLSFLILLGSCDDSPKVDVVVLTGKAMGSTYRVSYVQGEKQFPDRKRMQILIDGRLAAINQVMSTYEADSELSKFNANPSLMWIEVSTELYQILQEARRWYDDSRGMYDVTISPLLHLWGFGPDSLGHKIPSEVDIKKVKENIGMNNLEISTKEIKIRKKIASLNVDLSSLAPGYGVDMIAGVIESFGIKDYFVEIGGEIKIKGLKGQDNWKVGIASPTVGATDIARVLPISNVAIATSGSYRNFFEKDGRRYGHIINPLTGQPSESTILSVTVLDKSSCMRADALSTVLYVLGDEAIEWANKRNISALFFRSNKSGGVESIETNAFIEWTKGK